jgi:hypothetical protein
MRSFLLGILGTILLIACDPKVETTNLTPISTSKGFLIGNEGNFQWGNASLSLYDNSQNILYKDIYSSINNQSLGDVLQSVYYYQNLYYLVVNHSSKIEAINAKDFKRSFTLNGFVSPRYMLAKNEQKAYVSDMQANGVYVVNLETKKIEKTIPLAGWSEQMVLFENTLFVCSKNSEYLYLINTENDVVSDSILVAKGANSICLDAANKIWLACGGSLTNYTGYLFQIDPLNKKINKQFVFQANEAPTAIAFEKSNNTLYYLNGSLYQLNMQDSILPKQAIIDKAKANFYGFNIIDQQLILSDVKDFVQSAEISVYDLRGKKIKSFIGGINASTFVQLQD